MNKKLEIKKAKPEQEVAYKNALRRYVRGKKAAQAIATYLEPGITQFEDGWILDDGRWVYTEARKTDEGVLHLINLCTDKDTFMDASCAWYIEGTNRYGVPDNFPEWALKYILNYDGAKRAPDSKLDIVTESGM